MTNTVDYHKDYYVKNKESILERMRLQRTTPKFKERIGQYNSTEKRKNSNREASLKKRYGITIDDYNRMLHIQNGGCAICGIQEEVYKQVKGRNFDVDHCHSTGKVRGLLCYGCNVTLGFVKEDVKILENIISYIISSKKKC